MSSEKAGEETWTCDLRFVWSVHHIFYNNTSWDMKLNHTIVWEHPWFWRTDPIQPERLWFFISWDHLNGYRSLAKSTKKDERGALGLTVLHTGSCIPS